jgi:ubiquinone/menaquinone biosynthesis C-methylase UbiE
VTDEESERRRLRESFGPIADVYDRARPGYARAAIEWALAPLGRPPTSVRVLDLAAGTGKLTATLVELGADVVAIDLSEPMLAILRAKFTGVDVRVGTAEATGLPASDVDAVLIGSALHWFDRPSADLEIARVLRPGGVVATFQNRRDRTVPWVAAVEGVLGQRTDMRRVQRSEARRADFDAARFGPPESGEFPFTQTMTGDGLAELYESRSYVIDRPAAERAQLLKDIRAFARTHPDLAGRESFELPYRTIVKRQMLR